MGFLARFPRRLGATARPIGTKWNRPLTLARPSRWLATEAASEDALKAERISEDVDVCIVGAGPAGLSAAIKIRQLSLAAGNDVRVFVVEKGSEVGTRFDSCCPRASFLTLTHLLLSDYPNRLSYSLWSSLGTPSLE